MHGQINSFNVEYKAKKGFLGGGEHLEDVLITNSEFSYIFQNMDDDAYKRYLGLRF